MPTISLMPATMRVATLLLLASALLTAACGGGGDEGESFDGTTVRSDDGVLTVEVPKGAAADAVEVTIAAISEGELPAGLQGADADAVVIMGYELGPDEERHAHIGHSVCAKLYDRGQEIYRAK